MGQDKELSAWRSKHLPHGQDRVRRMEAQKGRTRRGALGAASTCSTGTRQRSSRSLHRSSNLARVRLLSMCFGPSAVAVMNGSEIDVCAPRTRQVSHLRIMWSNRAFKTEDIFRTLKVQFQSMKDPQQVTASNRPKTSHQVLNLSMTAACNKPLTSPICIRMLAQAGLPCCPSLALSALSRPGIPPDDSCLCRRPIIKQASGASWMTLVRRP